MSFATHEAGDVQQMDIDESTIDQHIIYKTLVASGKTTGPVVGVLPIDTHLDLKKIGQGFRQQKGQHGAIKGTR